MKSYTIYIKIPGHGIWIEEGGVEAKSAAAAIRQRKRAEREHGNQPPTGTKYKAVLGGSPRPNPLKIGKWIKAKIKKLRNGGYRVEVPGYGLPYGMRPKDR